MAISLKVLVTGAAGFIGSHTVDQLLAAGHEVWGVDNFRTGRPENLALALPNNRFRLEELDVAEERDFVEFVGNVKPDAIIHLAALVSVPESIANPALNDRLNFQATRIVAEAARQNRVSRIVFASSAAVYGDPVETPITEATPKKPLSPYGAAKLASEELLLDYAEKHGFVVRCQRYFNVYGPRQDPCSPYSGVISLFVDCVRNHRPPTIFGDGEQTRDFISVADVARANVIAATKENLKSGAANICTGRITTINVLWHLLSAPAQSLVLGPHYAPARSGDIRHSCGSVAVAGDCLDFRADIALPAGLEFLKNI